MENSMDVIMNTLRRNAAKSVPSSISVLIRYFKMTWHVSIEESCLRDRMKSAGIAVPDGEKHYGAAA